MRLNSKSERTEVPFENKMLAEPTTSFKLKAEMSNEPPSETNEAEAEKAWYEHDLVRRGMNFPDHLYNWVVSSRAASALCYRTVPRYLAVSDEAEDEEIVGTAASETTRTAQNDKEVQTALEPPGIIEMNDREVQTMGTTDSQADGLLKNDKEVQRKK